MNPSAAEQSPSHLNEAVPDESWTLKAQARASRPAWKVQALRDIPDPACPKCGQVMVARPAGIAALIGEAQHLAARPGALLDPGDLRYLMPACRGFGRVERTRERLLTLLQIHLEQLPRLELDGCPVCQWTRYAELEAERGDAKREIHCYNYASEFRTLYASRMYREIAGEVPRASPETRNAVLGVISFCGFAAQAGHA